MTEAEWMVCEDPSAMLKFRERTSAQHRNLAQAMGERARDRTLARRAGKKPPNNWRNWPPIVIDESMMMFPADLSERRIMACLIRCLIPFHPITFLPEWRTSTVLALAQEMYESRDFSTMPILADALQDAGCEDEAILTHCRGNSPHVRGCFCVDACLSRS